MKEKNLNGKRYIALARCSSAAQTDTSVDAQNVLIDNYARDRGMVKVDAVALDGVSGSVPGIRTDIDELIRRKLERDDFDVVVLQDVTRLTRSGTQHGMKLLFDLRAVGLRVAFVKDDVPDGEMGDVMRSLQFYASNEQARSIAHAATRGASASLIEGRSAHCKAPPYAVDRLYTSVDGTPKHIIRNLTDGTQLKLDPKSGVVIERFGRNEKTGVPAHYIKQKNERIVLVPGDPEHIKVVREIYERHFNDGWGYPRIARALNDGGVPSPRGGLWYSVSVRNVLLNPTYLGKGLANVYTSAIYYMRSVAGPVEAATDDVQLSSGRPRRRPRPREEWVERAETRLTGILDDSVKDVAAEKHEARFDALATHKPQLGNRDRHRESEFLLKGILVSRQGGYPMTGRRTGKKSCKKRYYAVGRAHAAPTSDRTLRRLIPAEPLEQCVLAALRLVLTESDFVRPKLRAVVLDQLRGAQRDDGDVAKLKSEKAKIERQMEFLVDELDNLGRFALKRKMTALQNRLKEIQRDLRRARSTQPTVADADLIVENVCKRLTKLGHELDSMPPATLRTLLQQFVSKLVIDLETREAEVEFALPDWASGSLNEVCLDNNLACKTDIEAHPILTVRRRIAVRRRFPAGVYDFAA